MASNDSVYVAYDKLLDTYIPFETASDALLANAALGLEKDDMSEAVVGIFNAVLAAVLNPSFNREEITVKDFYDIQCHVGKERLKALEVAERRADDAVKLRQSQRLSKSNATRKQHDFVGMPFVVFRCTLDLLGDLVDLYTELMAGNHVRFDSKVTGATVDIAFVRNVLYSMSLVHPTWTLPARRIYGKFYDLHSTECGPWPIYSLLRNPSFGEWSRQLVVRGEVTRLAEIPHFSGPHSPLSNIRSISFYRPHRSNISAVVDYLGRLQNPTMIRVTLDWYVKLVLETNEAFFQCLSESQALSTLQSVHIVCQCDFSAGPDLTDSLRSLTKIKSLCEIRLTDMSGMGQRFFKELIWRRQCPESSSSAFQVTSGTISRESRDYRLEADNNVENIKAILSKLQSIHVLVWPYWDGRAELQAASSATTLTLSISLGDGGCHNKLEVELPPSIEVLTLCLRLSDYCPHGTVGGLERWLARIREFISPEKSPKLRELHIFSFGPRRYDNERCGDEEIKPLNVALDDCFHSLASQNFMEKVIVSWEKVATDWCKESRVDR